MNTVCKENMCTGCTACVEKCPKSAIRIEDSLSAYNAVIDTALCVECKACYSVCQVNTGAALDETKKWWQGWAEDEEIRSHSSSGGAAAALETAFVQSGGYVCSCVFENGSFSFRVTNTAEEIKRFAGSKYVKSDPGTVFSSIGELLKNGQSVLFLGLPCQVAGLKNYLKGTDTEKLYTADIICHGTPSPRVLDSFLRQYNVNLSAADSIAFRSKGAYAVQIDGRPLVSKGTADCYSLAFLRGLTYTENCYECKFAAAERVSDVTLGDSWGNCLSAAVNRNGVSLILIQTEKGEQLISKARLHLVPVDYSLALRHNRQLNCPSEKPRGREQFFGYLKDLGFNKAVKKLLPKSYWRQQLKSFLLKVHIK